MIRVSTWEAKNFGVYVLGAGFSRAAGLPIAGELWNEVRRRAEKMEGRAEKFRTDLQYYIDYRAECDGELLTADTVNFEEFLGFLDVEFHLGLRGKDTWSVDGNETQVMVKTLIGEILTERMPKAIPKLYLDFAEKLKPYDVVLTFNYDVLLERSLEKVGNPYRLFPSRYKKISESGSAHVDSDRDEVVILKLHGSIDWFDRGSYRRGEEAFQKQGAPGHPFSPVFHPDSGISHFPLLDGPHREADPLSEVHRVKSLEEVYKKKLMFMETPLLIPPSATKILWFEKFKDFWWGMDRTGSLNFRMAIIGFSLAAHDEYARQVLYTIVKNYQSVEWGSEIMGKMKKPLLMVDFQQGEEGQKSYRNRYAFVDLEKAEIDFGGFGESALAKL